MLKFALFLIFFFKAIAISEHSERIEIASNGIARLVDDVSEKLSVRFKLVIVGNHSDLFKIVGKVINISSSPLTIQTIPSQIQNTYEFLNEHDSQIFLFSDDNYFIESPKKSSKYFPISQILIDYSHAKTKDFKNRAGVSESQFYSRNSYKLLHYSSKYLVLTKVLPFSSSSCHPSVKIVSVFKAKLNSWSVKLNNDSIYDFYGCPIDIWIDSSLEKIVDFNIDFHVTRDKLTNQVRLGGILGDILEEFGKRKRTFLAKKQSYSPSHDTLFNLVPNQIILDDRDEWFSAHFLIIPVKFMRKTFYVTRGTQYTYFEKMVLPFDDASWLCIIVTFAFVCISIFFINLCPTLHHKFTSCTGIRDPSLNLTQIFFGIGMVQTPGKNFSRFLLLNFIIFCLIIRTAYQGKVFEFLNADMRRPTAKKVQDLYDMNIKIVMNANTAKLLGIDSKFTADLDPNVLMERQRKFSNESFALPIKWLYGISFKHLHTNYDSNSEALQNSGKFMTMLEDSFDWSLLCLPIRRNSFLRESLQKFILEYYQHGLMAYSESKWYPRSKGAENEDEPQVLTMKMLAAGFIIWLICVMISVIVFVMEKIVYKLKINLRS